MTRLRYNGLRTTLGATLSTVATAITFAGALEHSGGTPVPTLTGGDYIPLALLNPSTGKLKEFVRLTAYTTGATTGTISRGQEGTTGVTHALNEIVVCAVLTADLDAVDTALAAKQPLDSDLTAIAAVATTSYGRALLALADAAAARTALALGTAATQAATAFDTAGAAAAAQAASQPLDADLTALASLTTSSYGRALLELANQAALMALIPAASDTVQGKVELATDAEAVAGTDTARAVTPASLLAALTAFNTYLSGTYQPLDSDLTALAALATTTYGRAFLELANQATFMGLIASASDTVQGKVELATDAETLTGTDATRAVTPHGLDARVATATAKGLVELATSAETATGTDAVRAVTPAGLDALLRSLTGGPLPLPGIPFTYIGFGNPGPTPNAGELAHNTSLPSIKIHKTDLLGVDRSDIYAPGMTVNYVQLVDRHGHLALGVVGGPLSDQGGGIWELQFDTDVDMTGWITGEPVFLRF